MTQGKVCFIGYDNILHPVKRLLERAGYEVCIYTKGITDKEKDEVVEADAVILAYTSLSTEIINQMQNCQVIVCIGTTGDDDLAITTASKKGIEVSIVPCFETVNDNRTLLKTAMETLRGLSGMPLKNKFRQASGKLLL